MYERIRLTPEERKVLIVNAGIDDAVKRGPYNITFATVAQHMENCSERTVRHYYNSHRILIDAIIAEAILVKNHFVIGAAVIMRNPLTYDLSKHMKDKCVRVYLDRRDDDT